MKLVVSYIKASTEKFNYLIDLKNDLELGIRCYIEVYEKLEIINLRIATVEAYLGANENNCEFIKNLYINTIKFRTVMEKYNIQNDKNLYRKADKILKIIL